jgi:hypothetical protein
LVEVAEEQEDQVVVVNHHLLVLEAEEVELQEESWTHQVAQPKVAWEAEVGQPW